MLYKILIIPQILLPATKIIKNYSKFPKNTTCDLETGSFARISFSQLSANSRKLLAGLRNILKFHPDPAEEPLICRGARPPLLYAKS
jgi:hypothetical protein